MYVRGCSSNRYRVKRTQFSFFFENMPPTKKDSFRETWKSCWDKFEASKTKTVCEFSKGNGELCFSIQEKRHLGHRNIQWHGRI